MKKLCTCITVALLLSFGARAQTWDWAKKLEASGATESVVIKGIDVDGSDNSYVTGYYKGTVSGKTSKGIDAFIAKFDALGNLQWFCNGGGDSTDAGNAISVETYSSGAVYITGSVQTGSWNMTFRGSGGDSIKVSDSCKTLVKRGKRAKQVFVAKYALDGTLLWVRLAYSSANLDAEGLALTSTYHHLNGATMERNVCVTGYFRGPNIYFLKNSCDSLRLVSQAALTAFVVKLSGINGNLLWGKSFDGGSGSLEDSSIGKGIAFDAAAALGYITNGGLYVTGNFTESVGISGTVLTHTTPDMAGYLAHLNPANGNVLWAKKIESSSGSDVIMRNLTFKEGNLDRLYAMGEYTGSSISYDGGTAVSSGGGRDFFLLQVAKTNGAETKLISDGGSGDQYVYGMDMVNWGNSGVNENIYISGGFDANVDFSGMKNFSGTNDQFMAKYDWDLNFICATRWDAGYSVGRHTVDMNDAAASKTNGTGFYGGMFLAADNPTFNSMSLSTTTGGAGHVEHWICCDCPPPDIIAITRINFGAGVRMTLSYPPCDNTGIGSFSVMYQNMAGGPTQFAPIFPVGTTTFEIPTGLTPLATYVWRTVNGCSNTSQTAVAKKTYTLDEGLDFKLSPNPADNNLTLQSDRAGSVRVYNMLGQRIADIKLDGQAPAVLEVSGFVSGNYICEFHSEQGDVVTERFVVQH